MLMAILTLLIPILSWKLLSQPVEGFYKDQGKLMEFDLPGGIPESWPKLLEALNLDEYEIIMKATLGEIFEACIRKVTIYSSVMRLKRFSVILRFIIKSDDGPGVYELVVRDILINNVSSLVISIFDCFGWFE
ncbi:adenylate kinase 1, chloroplastic-like protein, partial [Tanacetum coccineum]